MPCILIVDDDNAFRSALAEAVADLGHEPREAASGRIALSIIEEGGVDGVLLDLRMPGLDGIDVLRLIKALPSPPSVAVLTGHATAANTIEAMRLGAVDHLTKPITQEELRRVVEALLPPDVGGDEREEAGDSPSDELVGSSAAMRAVHKAIGRLADRDATVLVTGETGTGKELVAQAIHAHGRRSKHPFVAINCAAIPRDLLESELFGHARGAFTGATADHAGAFRNADRGTLFLDEIGDMDLGMQAKILRVLQDRTVQPVGGRPVDVDVRIVAATNQSLDQRVSEGLFREDLYYRLNVVPIHLPPLRERIADIVPLAEHFLRAANGPALGADAGAALLRYPWPGNVRELKNAMERVGVLVQAPRIAESDLAFLPFPGAGQSHGEPDDPQEDLPAAIARLEERMIRSALARAGGNRAEAARLLNIRRQYLYAKLDRYGLGAEES